MPYKVMTHLCAPDQVYREGDVFPEERYGAAYINAWLRDHWIEKIEEPMGIREIPEEPLPLHIVCPVPGCGKSYKTIKGFVKHVKTKHPEEL